MRLKHILWGRGGEEQARAYALTVYYSNLWGQVQHKQGWRTDHHFNHSQITAATVSSSCHWTFHYTDIWKKKKSASSAANTRQKKAFSFSFRGFLNCKNELLLSDSDIPQAQTRLWWPRCACSASVWGSLNCTTRCILIGVHQVELQKVHLQSFFWRPAQGQPFRGGLRCWKVWSEAASRWRLWWSRTTQCNSRLLWQALIFHPDTSYCLKKTH